MQHDVDVLEKQLVQAMQANPADEAAKLRYENFLAEARPDSVERQVLRIERELAALHGDQPAFDRLVDQYIEFRIKHSDYFWDQRGCWGFLRRSFKLWLVSFHESRRFTVEQALKLKIRASVDLDHLPAVLVASARPDVARSMKEQIVDVIRRYRGPAGTEQEVQPGEIVLTVTPSWMDRPR